MTPQYEQYLATHATPDELRAILGDRWAICRPTPRNLERYGNCVTRKQHAAAVAKAIASRR